MLWFCKKIATAFLGSLCWLVNIFAGPTIFDCQCNHQQFPGCLHKTTGILQVKSIRISRLCKKNILRRLTYPNFRKTNTSIRENLGVFCTLRSIHRNVLKPCSIELDFISLNLLLDKKQVYVTQDYYGDFLRVFSDFDRFRKNLIRRYSHTTKKDLLIFMGQTDT